MGERGGEVPLEQHGLPHPRVVTAVGAQQLDHAPGAARLVPGVPGLEAAAVGEQRQRPVARPAGRRSGVTPRGSRRPHLRRGRRRERDHAVDVLEDDRVVGQHEHRPLPRPARQRDHQPAGRLRVEAGRRLVEHEHAPRPQQGARDRRAAAADRPRGCGRAGRSGCRSRAAAPRRTRAHRRRAPRPAPRRAWRRAGRGRGCRARTRRA